MAMKLLLVAFSTTRLVEVGGKEEERRVRFASKSVVDLTDDELQLLDDLTKATGKVHYRDPISEGSAVAASEPEIVDIPDYEGQDVALTDKTVAQLKAYLTFHSVDFDNGANKADLLALAQSHEAGTSDDPDSGL